MKMLYQLGIGSNQGDRAANLSRGQRLLREAGITTQSSSALYETEPVGLKDQPWFLNQVLAVETALLPMPLLEEIKRIEKQMGRTPAPVDGPRLIDIDILLAGDEIVDCIHLQIPHPRLTERKFVLVPLAEIAASTIHPLQQRTIQELKAECPDPSLVRPHFRPDSHSDD